MTINYSVVGLYKNPITYASDGTANPATWNVTLQVTSSPGSSQFIVNVADANIGSWQPNYVGTFDPGTPAAPTS